jgi:hypothetical protein
MSAHLTAYELAQMARKNIEDRLRLLLRDASDMNLVVTVGQVPRVPLAMGSYDTVHEVREVLRRAN